MDPIVTPVILLVLSAILGIHALTHGHKSAKPEKNWTATYRSAKVDLKNVGKQPWH